jgi:predicted RNase H-like HicB family nuclease
MEGYLATVPEFPGCMTAGATEAEALENLQEAMEAWLMTVLSSGQHVPEPSPMPSLREDLSRWSGRMLVRMPRSLHRQLIEQAEAEGVSANQLAVSILAAGIGQKSRLA